VIGLAKEKKRLTSFRFCFWSFVLKVEIANICNEEKKVWVDQKKKNTSVTNIRL